MTTVADVLSFLETLAPQKEKMDWDNVGLLCGSRKKEVTKILIALDPFEAVAAEAAAIGADLIVTHHPLIFRPIRSVTDDSSIGRTIQALIRADISAINAHTNLDCAPGGVNDILASKLGLQNIRVINPTHTDENGREWGLLRQGNVEEQPLAAFLQTVKDNLHCPVLRYTEGAQNVRRVAVGGGACADELCEALDAGCDTFVTSDIKYNPFWDAHDNGLNLIDAGHFYTENPICEVLYKILSDAFPEIHVEISKVHADCMKFF